LRVVLFAILITTRTLCISNSAVAPIPVSPGLEYNVGIVPRMLFELMAVFYATL
jgi:hypothetical protein